MRKSHRVGGPSTLRQASPVTTLQELGDTEVIDTLSQAEQDLQRGHPDRGEFLASARPTSICDIAACLPGVQSKCNESLRSRLSSKK